MSTFVEYEIVEKASNKLINKLGYPSTYYEMGAGYVKTTKGFWKKTTFKCAAVIVKDRDEQAIAVYTFKDYASADSAVVYLEVFKDDDTKAQLFKFLEDNCLTREYCL